MSGRAEEIGNLGGLNTSPEPKKMSILELNSTWIPTTIYILVTPTFLNRCEQQQQKTVFGILALSLAKTP